MPKVYPVISVHHVLRVFNVEGVFSSEEKRESFLTIAKEKNPGLEFFSQDPVEIDASRYTESEKE